MRVRKETMTYAGAQRLAEIIKDYWAKRGKEVETWIESTKGPTKNNEDVIIHCVRSNIKLKKVAWGRN